MPPLAAELLADGEAFAAADAEADTAGGALEALALLPALAALEAGALALPELLGACADAFGAALVALPAGLGAAALPFPLPPGVPLRYIVANVVDASEEKAGREFESSL